MEPATSADDKKNIPPRRRATKKARSSDDKFRQPRVDGNSASQDSVVPGAHAVTYHPNNSHEQQSKQPDKFRQARAERNLHPAWREEEENPVGAVTTPGAQAMPPSSSPQKFKKDFLTSGTFGRSFCRR